MKRTTIFADEDMLARLRSIARREGTSVARLIRTALERFIAEHRGGRTPPSLLGAGRSGRSDVAERHEQLLWKARK